MAIGVDALDRPVVGRQERERLLGPLAVGEVAEGLAVAAERGLLGALRDRGRVGLERVDLPCLA